MSGATVWKSVGREVLSLSPDSCHWENVNLGGIMPVISIFYGIMILMFYSDEVKHD